MSKIGRQQEGFLDPVPWISGFKTLKCIGNSAFIGDYPAKSQKFFMRPLALLLAPHDIILMPVCKKDVAMFDEELPKPKTEGFPRNLENMSVAELEDYIAEMKAEIERVEGDIAKKKASEDAAASVFK